MSPAPPQELRFLACILSSAGIVALLGGTVAYSGHHGSDLPRFLAAALLVMVGIGVPGAWLIFRPVARYLSSDGGEPPLRLRGLPRLSALWLYLLTAVTVGWHAGTSHGADPRRPAEAAALPEAVARHHAFVREALQMDVVAAGLLTVMLIALIVRGVARPMRILLEAMRKVDRGDLCTRAPVVSDDELGALTERFNLMVGALAERERMRRTFSRFVPDEVAGALLAGGAIVPQEREASVLYADIERFTSAAAALAPAEILSMLNICFREVAEIIHGHGGVITQFQGDAVLAGFNLPAALPHHARHAVQAALEIRDRLDSLELASGMRLRMRVGVSTGRVIGGTVGGEKHLGYTLHGDTVNRAAQLEELNKELGTRVLIDGRTAGLLGDAARLRDHGAEALRAFASPVRVFEPLLSPVDTAHA